MASFTPTREETYADQRLYLSHRLVDVACLDCVARVQVKKNSRFHTSIQWTAGAVDHCAEFARGRSRGDRVVHESCSRLKASIERAFEEGALLAEERTAEPDG